MSSRVGQFAVVRTNSPVAWLIRLATRSQVNHAVICVSDGRVVEAQPGGARFGNIPAGAVWSHFPLTDAQAIAVAEAAQDLVDTPYGFLDIAALALVSLGIQWRWAKRIAKSDKGLICSQLVDRAYRNAGIHLYTDGRDDGSVTPGDLLLLLAHQSTETEVPA